ncbi:unnamed protein product [Lactuca virosa]|uniref:Uncharacterized protein n=1 Tax=Lactuca virosa TaxID=75947 RepID=A0AAU9NJ86_9ASTR|nr:unnamed protein product [Lactuca virosa]
MHHRRNQRHSRRLPEKTFIDNWKTRVESLFDFQIDEVRIDCNRWTETPILARLLGTTTQQRCIGSIIAGKEKKVVYEGSSVFVYLFTTTRQCKTFNQWQVML